MRSAIASLALLAGGCAGAGGAPDGVAAADVERAVRDMYEAFKQKSLDAVAPHMSEGSTCYDVYTSKLLVGRKAVLDHFVAILARHKPDEKWEATLEDMKVDVEGDLAVATYKVSTRAEGAHMLAAVTHVFRRQGGRWVAVHLHRSWNSPPGK
jgi:ketosteroid isomerase-like protein